MLQKLFNFLSNANPRAQKGRADNEHVGLFLDGRVCHKELFAIIVPNYDQNNFGKAKIQCKDRTDFGI